jgi:hypothetical protein
MASVANISGISCLDNKRNLKSSGKAKEIHNKLFVSQAYTENGITTLIHMKSALHPSIGMTFAIITYEMSR